MARKTDVEKADYVAIFDEAVQAAMRPSVLMSSSFGPTTPGPPKPPTTFRTEYRIRWRSRAWYPEFRQVENETGKMTAWSDFSSRGGLLDAGKLGGFHLKSSARRALEKRLRILAKPEKQDDIYLYEGGKLRLKNEADYTLEALAGKSDV